MEQAAQAEAGRQLETERRQSSGGLSGVKLAVRYELLLGQIEGPLVGPAGDQEDVAGGQEGREAERGRQEGQPVELVVDCQEQQRGTDPAEGAPNAHRPIGLAALPGHVAGEGVAEGHVDGGAHLGQGQAEAEEVEPPGAELLIYLESRSLLEGPLDRAWQGRGAVSGAEAAALCRGPSGAVWQWAPLGRLELGARAAGARCRRRRWLPNVLGQHWAEESRRAQVAEQQR